VVDDGAVDGAVVMVVEPGNVPDEPGGLVVCVDKEVDVMENEDELAPGEFVWGREAVEVVPLVLGEETMPVLEVVADLEEEGGDGVGKEEEGEPELPG
jgi:hypothetical protein